MRDRKKKKLKRQKKISAPLVCLQVDGVTDDGRTAEQGYSIRLTCEPNDLG